MHETTGSYGFLCALEFKRENDSSLFAGCKKRLATILFGYYIGQINDCPESASA